MFLLLSTADLDPPKTIKLQKPTAKREMSCYDGDPNPTFDQSRQTYFVVVHLILASGSSKTRIFSSGQVEKGRLAFGVLEYVSTQKRIRANHRKLMSLYRRRGQDNSHVC